MPIIVNLDVMMAKRKVGAGELAKAIGITPGQPFCFKKTAKPRRCVLLPWRLYAGS